MYVPEKSRWPRRVGGTGPIEAGNSYAVLIEVLADAEAQELRRAAARPNYRRTLFTLRGSVAVNAALWGVNSVRSHSLDELAWNDRNERYAQGTEDQEDEHD